MKVKVKLDIGTIKKSLITHGEKVAFGAIMLVFVMFAYSAMKREVLDSTKQPDVLKQKATETSSHVSRSTFKADRENVKLVEYDQRAKREEVVAAAFALPRPFDPLIADEKTRRDDPQVFSIEEPQAAGGFGAFALKSGKPSLEKRGNSSTGGGSFRPSADSELKATPWAVVTALVPVQKQAAEYVRAFDRAKGADRSRDKPQYVGFVLERAEIDEASPDKLEWKPVPFDAVKDFITRWESPMADIVSQNYIERALTSPLGPLVGMEWNASVAHPKIPLADADKRAPAAVADAAPKGGEDAPPPKAAEGGFGETGFGSDDTPPPAPISAPTAPGKTPEVITHHLLRVFDVTVEPTKKYRYRVKLRLRNPNFDVLARYLKNAESRTKPILETEWSEPTGVVTVPNGYRVLAAAGPKKPISTLDPTARAVLTSIDKKQGIEAAYEMEMSRGSVANAVKTVEARDPRNGQWFEMPDVDFKTGFVVLDIRGARPISRKDKELLGPVEVLVMDPQGNLWVRNEFDDHLTVATLKRQEEEVGGKGDEIPDDAPKPRTKAKKSATGAGR